MKEHKHFWQATAYFWDEGNIDEWLVLMCEECETTKVIRGKNQRDGIENSGLL